MGCGSSFQNHVHHVEFLSQAVGKKQEIHGLGNAHLVAHLQKMAGTKAAGGVESGNCNTKPSRRLLQGTHVGLVLATGEGEHL